MGTELAGGPTGRVHILRAGIVVAIGQSVFRYDALCLPGQLSAAGKVAQYGWESQVRKIREVSRPVVFAGVGH